jgi:molybdopterin converting factor small subunit
MSVKVIIPTPLRPYAGKRDSTEVKAGTVGEALGRLTTEFSELRKHLFTDDGKLRSFVNVYVNDEDIRYLAKENTPTKDGDTISIVPSIAGGSCFFTIVVSTASPQLVIPSVAGNLLFALCLLDLHLLAFFCI